MAQAYVKLDKDDERLVINTKLAERVWLQSPSTTGLDNNDINFIKQLVLFAIRSNDDETLRFIHEMAWQIMLLSRKTQSLPESLATEIEQMLNTTSNLGTCLIYAYLGPPGAGLINMGQIDDPDRFKQGPMSRLIPLAVIFTVLGQGMEDQLPEDIVDQVMQQLAAVAQKLLHPTDNTITGYCITNHLEKIMTKNFLVVPRSLTSHRNLGEALNKTLQMSISWNNLRSPNNCAMTWCADPLPNNTEQLLYHNMNTMYIKDTCAALLIKAQSQAKLRRLSPAPPLPPRATKTKRQRRKATSYSSPFGISPFNNVSKDDQNNEDEETPPLEERQLFDDMPPLEEIPPDILSDSQLIEEKAYVPDDPKISPEPEKSKTPQKPTSNAEHSDENTGRVSTVPSGVSVLTGVSAQPRGYIGRQDEEGTATCYICYDTTTGLDKTTKLSCNHTFHTHCLHDWLIMQNTCPTCRRPVHNHARGMLLQEPTPKTILYTKTMAVTSTDADRSQLEIDTMSQSAEAINLLFDPNRPVIDTVQVSPATHNYIRDVGNREPTGIYENPRGLYGGYRETDRNV